MSIAIAHFRRGLVLRGALLLAAFIVLLSIAILYSPNGHVAEHVSSAEPLMYPMGIVTAVGFLWILWLCCSAIEKVIFENGEAVWLERGRVIYLSKLLFSAKFEDIETITAGTYGKYKKNPGIVIEMRNGKRKIFPTVPLIESDEHIIARIRDGIASYKRSN